jgi:hypothetical protein
MHEDAAHDEVHALNVANTAIVFTEGLEDAGETFLPRSFLQEIGHWESPAHIPVDLNLWIVTF